MPKMFDDDKCEKTKYNGKAIRWIDKENHYELIFTDIFDIPGKASMDECEDNVLTDILIDMKNADKNKELHIFINSYGGSVVALNLILQQVLEFRYRVSICTGAAASCGWMLFFACQERYASPFSHFMFHEMSAGMFDKISNNERSTTHDRKWWNELLNYTYTKSVLTEEELKLGETAEVWFTGKELFERGAVLPYAMYEERRCLNKVDCVRVGEYIFYKFADNEYCRFKPVDLEFSYDYSDLVYLNGHARSKKDLDSAIKVIIDHAKEMQKEFAKKAKKKKGTKK